MGVIFDGNREHRNGESPLTLSIFKKKNEYSGFWPDTLES